VIKFPSIIFVDGVVNISCKGLILSVEEAFIELEEADGKGNDGSSKLNKSREVSLIVDGVGLGIDVIEGDGVIVGVERSLPACRTGLVDDTGAANGFFNFGILF
jgi:hypothetical protein